MGNEDLAITENGLLAITYHENIPRLVEVVSVTGKRARIRKPDSPLGSEVRSLPIGDLYAYEVNIWEQMKVRNDKIQAMVQRNLELAKELKPLITTLSKRTGGVHDSFWD